MTWMNRIKHHLLVDYNLPNTFSCLEVLWMLHWSVVECWFYMLKPVAESFIVPGIITGIPQLFLRNLHFSFRIAITFLHIPITHTEHYFLILSLCQDFSPLFWRFLFFFTCFERGPECLGIKFFVMLVVDDRLVFTDCRRCHEILSFWRRQCSTLWRSVLLLLYFHLLPLSFNLTFYWIQHYSIILGTTLFYILSNKSIIANVD